MAELRAYDPTWRDTLAALLVGDGRVSATKRAVLEGLLGSTGLGSTGSSLVDFTPAGMVLAADEAARSASADNYGAAAVDAAGALPGGLVAAAVAKGLKRVKQLESFASRSANIYNPPMKSPRPFEADYPLGAQADEAGRLTHSIEGTPLSARYVVGRRDVSGPDVALPREALDEIAKARTGEAIRRVAPRSAEIGRDVGRAAFRRGGEPDYVAVSRALGPEQGTRVAAHEIGHVIDKAAGEIPVSGLDDQFRSIYNDLNNPQSYGKKWGPEQNRYRSGDVQRELMAEAIRAYMTDPNYIKTVAPEVAARIREYVNTHHDLKNVIQFNSLVAAGAAGAAALAPGEAEAAENGMANPFDQFDAPQQNPFDRFDEPRARQGHANVPEYVPPGVEGYDPATGEVARDPRTRLASAAYGAADVGTFGFGDEVASYLGSALTGTPRDQVLAEMRGLQGQAQRDNPGSYLAGQVAGGLAQGAGLVAGGLSPTAHAINAGWRLPGVAAASGVEGGILGALHGAGAGTNVDERLGGAAQGLAMGGVLGAASPYAVQGVSNAVRRAVTPFRASPERVAAAQTLRAEGVPVTAGQLTGNRSLRFAESEIGGRRAANIMDQQKDAFTSAVLRRAGVNANRASPEVIDDAFRTVGQQFDNLVAANQLAPDAQMVRDLRSVFNEYGNMVPESQRAPIVENLTNDIVAAIRRGPMSGDAYQNLTSRIARSARGASNPDLQRTLYGIRNVLDDAMERSIGATNPAHAGAWRAAREQYRNLLAIEQAATRAGEAVAEGVISPGNIRNAAVSQGRRAYARGQGDFADLARAGSMLLSPLPDSGTAGRLRAQNLAAMGPLLGGAIIGGGAGAYQSGDMTGALTGAAIGAAAPRVAGSLMMSRVGQGLLGNQLLAREITPQMRAVMSALAVNQASGPVRGLLPSP